MNQQRTNMLETFRKVAGEQNNFNWDDFSRQTWLNWTPEQFTFDFLA